MIFATNLSLKLRDKNYIVDEGKSQVGTRLLLAIIYTSIQVESPIDITCYVKEGAM